VSDPVHGRAGGNGVPAKAKPEEVEKTVSRQQSQAAVQYPTDYTFKIMGLADADFQDHALGLVAQVVALGEPPRVSSRSVGKYVSISVSVLLQAEAERRAVYQLLWEDKRVVYYL
jgi:hypothetical protein